MDAIVVGAGIFGSLIARALRRSGRKVLVLDDKRRDAGSAPAACLMRPSWFSSLGKDVYDPALKILDDLVGVQDLKFLVTSKLATTVHWCDPKRVLLDQNEVRTGCVGGMELQKDGSWSVWATHQDGGRCYSARLVVVAAGIWTPLLFPEIEVTGQAGVAWLWPAGRIEEPFIRVWAPYKQIVAFNRGDGLWIGDGTTVRHWSRCHEEAALRRCIKALGNIEVPPKRLFGYRPYVKDSKPCLLKELRPGLWIATGGAKNGTLAAGWCADQVIRATT